MKDRGIAVAALQQMLTDQGDTDPWESLYELRQLGSAMYAEPKDIDADFHLHWNGVEWDVAHGALPHPPGPRHWWRGVRIRAIRYGVRTPVTVPEAALRRWEEGMAMSWYTQHHLEDDLGLKRKIPTLDEFITAREKCRFHHEPITDDGCVVAGCTAL
jgi:hypothetical protein